MKALNISSLPYAELKNYSKRWLFIFLSLFFVEIIILGVIHHQHKSRYNQLINEIQTLESFIATQQHIIETKSQLTKDYDFMINKKTYLTGNTKLPILMLKHLSKTIPSDCCISLITFKNNIFSIKGMAKNWIGLNKFFEELSQMTTLGSMRLKSTSKESHFINFEIEFNKNKTR